ncbi:hypothetical protein CYLTODRAFT_424895 [Cylindrobasidium torrendii FP15055 ss-10]|uniref:Zn(2)-C6 fungal-type domain-containing protein n=1 Tax=Cylindrobasidium torrendii FP15055 ss-10 TaxID=1314674 RepID=A0A0D7B2H0_9AGAR|nr:hypothetical protein CYLTODRAFT_424895 [Cylindrobasidium torrendii FP15055 ss-10]
MFPAPKNSGSRKRRRGSDAEMPPPPKRAINAACTPCKRSKNKCNGEKPCKRCDRNDIKCVFAKTGSENLAAALVSLDRISRFEEQYVAMQSSMSSMVTSLDRILAILQRRATPSRPPSATTSQRSSSSSQSTSFPSLPGFAPPPRKYGHYGLIPNEITSQDGSTIPLPSFSLNAPVAAVQDLANAVSRAEESGSPPPVTKEPLPEPAFPHVVEQDLVPESEARELFNLFFAGCHLFIPIFDDTYDTYESLSKRSPWTFDTILAIASKIRSGSGPMTETFYTCLTEAQGIARSSLFGPIVRKEAVQGMLLLAAWSTQAWLPSGHAVHMALDLGLHHALDKLANNTVARSKEEERDLVVSARIWLCVYWFSHQMNLRTGRPVVLRDESLVQHARILLSHSMVSPTDLRLVAQVELISQKADIYETLEPLRGRINDSTLVFIREATAGLDEWFQDFDAFHHLIRDQHSLLRNFLAGELHFTKLWLVCVALSGVDCSAMSFQQREVAFQAKDAALEYIKVFLNGDCRSALRYAAHDTLMITAFAGVYLLKMVNLFPDELEVGGLTDEVMGLADLLSYIAAERYALPLRILLAYLRRKPALHKEIRAPAPTARPTSIERIMVDPMDAEYGAYTMEELGYAVEDESEKHDVIALASVPEWLQHQSMMDLGLPTNGLDGIFIELHGADGWTGDFSMAPGAW